MKHLRCCTKAHHWSEIDEAVGTPSVLDILLRSVVLKLVFLGSCAPVQIIARRRRAYAAYGHNDL